MIKMLMNLLLLPTIGSLMMVGYALYTKDYGLAIASFAVTFLGIVTYTRTKQKSQDIQDEWVNEWKGNIKGINPKSLLKGMVKRGVVLNKKQKLKL